MESLTLFKEVSAQVYTLGQIQIKPSNLAIIQTVKASIQSTTEVNHESIGVLFQELQGEAI